MDNDFIRAISLPGYDITDTDPRHFSINSDYPSPKMEEQNVAIVSYTFPSNPAIGSTTNMLTINHGYSYIPAAIVYVKDVTANRFSILPYQVVPLAQYISTYTTSTQLIVEYKCPVSNAVNMTGRVFKLKYYIFVENGR